MNKFSFLIVFLIGISSLHAQIVNSGNLYISSGTSVYFADDYTNSGTHQNSGELHLKGNLTNNGTMTPVAGGTTYFDSATTTTQVIQGSSNSAKFSNLNINNAATDGKSLEVSDGVGLQVANVLHIEEDQKLRLMGSSQLVQTHGGVSTNTGLGHLLKDQDGAKNAYRYNYWSSPVQNESAAENKYNLSTVLKDGTTPDLWSPVQAGFTTAKNGTNGSPIAISTKWLWIYTNGIIDAWNSGWYPLFNSGTTTPSSYADMSPGVGFSMKGTDSAAALADLQNYSFEGEPNDGKYEITIGAEKEYLVGNPYPSAMDADLFIDDNIDTAGGGANPVIDGTVYYWDHWSTNTHVYTYYGGGYATYTKSGGVHASLHAHFVHGSGSGTAIPLQYIPVGQGFIVRSAGTSGGTITFQNSQRVFMEEGASSIQLSSGRFDRNGVASRIRLDYQGPDSRIRHTMLAFTDGSATDAFDFGYDGKTMLLGKNDMYFTIGESSISKPYIIQGVGMFDEDSKYPITIKAKTAGKHRISILDLENFGEDLYIEDEKGQTHDLKDGDYTFYTTPSQKRLHFNLVFKPAPQPTDVQDNLNDFVATYYYDHNIVIQNDKNMTLTGMQVYNSLGQLVLQIDDSNRLSKREVYIPFNNFASTAYVIKLQAKSGTGTYKFINY